MKNRPYRIVILDTIVPWVSVKQPWQPGGSAILPVRLALRYPRAKQALRVLMS